MIKLFIGMSMIWCDMSISCFQIIQIMLPCGANILWQSFTMLCQPSIPSSSWGSSIHYSQTCRHYWIFMMKQDLLFDSERLFWSCKKVTTARSRTGDLTPNICFSGFLVSLLLSKDLVRKKKFNAVGYYLHRYLRLTAPFLVVTLGQGFLAQIYIRGPFEDILNKV